MKKIFVIVLILILALSLLTACGESGGMVGDGSTVPASQGEGSTQDGRQSSEEEGGEGNLSNNWPEALPASSISYEVVENTESSFTITFFGATKEGIIAYAEQLKTAGYTVNEELIDEGGSYSYTASGDNGWRISVRHNPGGAGIQGNAE